MVDDNVWPGLWEESDQIKLRVIVDLLKEALLEWREAFSQLIDDQAIGADVRHYLLEHKLDVPDFKISMHSGALVVRFQLPKSLATLWWDGPVEVWDPIYQRLMPVIWRLVDEKISAVGSDMQLIYGDVQNDRGEYYYLWNLRLETNPRPIVSWQILS